VTAYSHVWGASRAADSVWCHVNGLAPSKAAKRLLMVWQGYIDESIDAEHFVFAGYLAPAEAWAQFAEEWDAMLRRMGVLAPNGTYRFKMSEMAALPERMDRVPGFYRIIEKHISMAISFTLNLSEFEAGKRRVLSIDPATNQIRNVVGASIENPYVFAFAQMMASFHKFRLNPDVQELIPPNERVDFIFDQRLETRLLLECWDQFMENTGGREMYGATPRFEDDDEFLPLQAADFKAWWSGSGTAQDPTHPAIDTLGRSSKR
jgi:hypothetical protein